MKFNLCVSGAQPYWYCLRNGCTNNLYFYVGFFGASIKMGLALHGTTIFDCRNILTIFRSMKLVPRRMLTASLLTIRKFASGKISQMLTCKLSFQVHRSRGSKDARSLWLADGQYIPKARNFCNQFWLGSCVQ